MKKHLIIYSSILLALISCESFTPEAEAVVDEAIQSDCWNSVSSIKIDDNLEFIAIDSIFEQLLVRWNKDSDGVVNGYISKKDAEKIIGISIVAANVYEHPESAAKSTKGIEYFKNAETLYIVDGLIDSIDLSYNTKLRKVLIADDVGGAVGGASLDLRIKSRVLKYINFGHNDNLEEIVLSRGIYKEVDISGLPNLKKFEISGDSLKTIYISHKDQIRPDWQIFLNNNQKIEYKVCNRN
jgi:hypothetical protein